MTASVVLTFRRGPSFCRHYAVALGDGAYEGIACRSADDKWRIELHTTTRTPSGATPAGAGNVRDMAMRLTDGGFLEADEEARVVARRWKPDASEP